MSDFRQQVREHYDARSLAPEKVTMILARGRDAAGGKSMPLPVSFPKRKPWARSISLMAALLALAFLGLWWSGRDVGKVSYALLAPRVIEFFSGTPELVPSSQNKDEVKAWLVSKGAPPDFQIPQALLPLESAACQVVDVKGEKAYMSCYWTEKKPDRGIHELVHLLVARADDFHDQPKSEQPAVRELNGWSFASWTKGEVLYTLATAAPPEKLTPYTAAIRNDTASVMSMIVAGDR
ncbi:MAG: hypothetical protein V4733_09275 [Verrucomicrobiota bacterium]